MVSNGFNVPIDYLKARKKAKYKVAKGNVAKPDDLDWSYVYTNEQLETITKTTKVTYICKIQHYKYVAHFTRLKNKYFLLVNVKFFLVIGGKKFPNS